MKTLDPTPTLQALHEALPSTPLFGEEGHVGWRLSPEPFSLTPEQGTQLQQIGEDLSAFAQAINALVRKAQKTPELSWVYTLYTQGKPQTLNSFAQMNRFKQEVPRVIRPDLLLTDEGFQLCEIDAVPGGLGFTGALYQAYQALGFDLLGENIPQAFLRLVQSVTTVPNPTIAVVVSDEAGDYRKEWAWLVSEIQTFYPQMVLCHPKDLTLMHNRLGVLAENQTFTPIDVIYRFFELFDLPNIPQIELIQYAVKKGLVTCTPPFKPYLEEKLTLGLIHLPQLHSEWATLMGEATLSRLQQLIPQTWILDPTPVPYFAQISPPMAFEGKVISSFEGLKTLTQKQRQLVIKPSGFSPLAWGSRGVVIGHDTPQVAWQQAVEEALASFTTTPHLLQRFSPPQKHPYRYFDAQGQIVEAQGRTRLCPYYFVEPTGVRLVGTLATTCPVDKKIIHGMKDGVMRPTLSLGG